MLQQYIHARTLPAAECIASRSKLTQMSPPGKQARTALFVTGQLRLLGVALPSLHRLLSPLEGGVDLFYVGPSDVSFHANALALPLDPSSK